MDMRATSGREISSMIRHLFVRTAVCAVMVCFCNMPDAYAGVVITDDFNDEVLSHSLWSVWQNEVSVVQQGGFLKITAPVGTRSSGGVTLIPVISGDFDVKVDYRFLSGTSSSPNDRTRVGLSIHSTETGSHVFTHIWRGGTPSDGAVMLHQDNTGIANIWSPPSNGALRLMRVLDVVTAYYYRNGWQYIGSVGNFGDPVVIGMNGSLEGGMALDLELDNFSVVAAIPEPATMSLLAIGGLCLLKRRK